MSYKAKLMLFTISLLLIQCSTKKNFLKSQTSSQGTIAVTIDNDLNEISINGNDVPLSGPVNDWTQAKEYNVQIQEGDQIAITATNEGGPAGVLATITYTDNNGDPQEIDTSSNWLCDGIAVLNEGANGVGPWGFISGISANAQWIWNPNNPVTTTCTITIPTSFRKGNGSIAITVDNIITNITVNGVPLNLPAGSDNWPQLKLISNLGLEVNDQISIYATNIGGPAGVLATITYYDEFNKIQTIDTGVGWTCDSIAPLLEGANGVAPWGTISGISSTAQWIWNPNNPPSTVCSVTIPRTRCKN